MNALSELWKRTSMLTLLLSWMSLCPTEAKAGRDHLQFTVNGVRFTYDLSSVRGDCDTFDRPSIHLKSGDYLTPFYCTRDKIWLAGGRSFFSGVIRPLRNPNVTLTTLKTEAKPGGEAKGMFSPLYKAFETEFRTITGRRWFVSTEFEDAGKSRPANRTYWTIDSGLLVTLNATILPHISVSREWRNKRFEQLEELVSRVTISR
jgi:hypothetical protein